MNTKDYLEKNRAAWNQRTISHIESDFYDQQSFLEGRNSLNPFELDLLEEVKGKKILHLQCHFGQDSISLSRMGADVTGVDLSDQSIAEAKKAAAQVGTNTRFFQNDVLSFPKVHDEKYDIVFTSYGTIGWLPDVKEWAKVVKHFLKPGGFLLIVEFHPVVWMYDDDFQKVIYPYFNKEAILETEKGSYASKEANYEFEYVGWNHPISDVMNAVIGEGLSIEVFNEYDHSPYDCFGPTEEFEKGKFRIKHMGNHLPMVYALKARRG